jgi:hypothetical protein
MVTVQDTCHVATSSKSKRLFVSTAEARPNGERKAIVEAALAHVISERRKRPIGAEMCLKNAVSSCRLGLPFVKVKRQGTLW